MLWQWLHNYCAVTLNVCTVCFQVKAYASKSENSILQELDLLTVKPATQASASSRKQQRSIRDFFASPPSVPLAKRFKAHSTAPPDSALKPHPTAQREQKLAGEVDQSACEAAAQTPARHEAAPFATAYIGGTCMPAPSCSERHASTDQTESKQDPTSNACASHLLAGQGTFVRNPESTSSRPVLVAAASPGTSQTQSRNKVKYDAGSKLDLCGEVDMEDKENVCCVSADA